MDTNIYESIYEARRKADLLRQPAHKLAVEELHAAIQRHGHRHPYLLAPKDYEPLERYSAFQAVALGPLGTADSSYCYRISSWSRVLKDTKPPLLASIVPKDREGKTDEAEVFSFLLHKSQRVGGWLPLSLFLNGNYSGPRNFSWWTTAVMPNDPSVKTMCTAHQCGLLNTDVAPEALILRCPAQFVKAQLLARVPSVIDAFFFSIFCATAEEDSPACGRSISVEDPSRLSLGSEELLLKPLDVRDSRIEIYPVKLFGSGIHKIYFTDVEESLQSYYQDLTDV